MATRAYIALGSNLGDSPSVLAAALEALGGSPGVELVGASASYRTAPVGGPEGQRDYLNGAAELSTELGAHALLARLQEIELEFGRRREQEERWGPRTLDLDLLLYGDLVLADVTLELPHPRLEERRFVLEPLAEIAPELVLPRSGRRVREALAELDSPGVRAGAERRR